MLYIKNESFCDVDDINLKQNSPHVEEKVEEYTLHPSVP